MVEKLATERCPKPLHVSARLFHVRFALIFSFVYAFISQESSSPEINAVKLYILFLASLMHLCPKDLIM
jgi:uncharacterized membrane protein YagU involved in acid resistance